MVHYRQLALPGILWGMVLTLLGAFTLLATYVPSTYASIGIGQLLETVGAAQLQQIGMVVLLLGILSYIWGHGLLRQADWSLFLSALYLFHAGLYVALLLGLLFIGQMAFRATRLALPSISGLPAGVLETGIALLPLLIGFACANLILRSPQLLRAYEQKYELRMQEKQPHTCPNPACRVILPKDAKRCERCNPLQIEARLSLLNNAREQYTLRFTRGRERVQLSRFLPGASRRTQTIYFDPTKESQYERISAPHAEIIYDGEQDQYTIVDVGSRNGTLVDGEPVTRQAVLLQDGAEVVLGGAHFRFSLPLAVDGANEATHLHG